MSFGTKTKHSETRESLVCWHETMCNSGRSFPQLFPRIAGGSIINQRLPYELAGNAECKCMLSLAFTFLASVLETLEPHRNQFSTFVLKRPLNTTGTRCVQKVFTCAVFGKLYVWLPDPRNITRKFTDLGGVLNYTFFFIGSFGQFCG